MKKFLAVILSTSLMFGSVSPAMAKDRNWDRHDRNDWKRHERHYDRHDHKKHKDNGAAIALGILGVGAALMIASNAQPVYAAPAPVYYEPPQPTYVQRTYVQKSYVPVVQQRTVYQPQYQQVSEWVPVY